ncbi:MAG TPA: hypothetical protein VG651_13760 [Stellaceae bacterium]|nr:hypothetical protein [Stellaceae bacterium]
MRVPAAVMGLLLAGLEPGIAASSNPGYTPEEAHAGCYKTDLRVCMISLGTVFWFDMGTVAAQIAKRNELDVNGRTARRKITIDARPPGKTEIIGITLTLASPAPNDRVEKVELDLPGDPELAHTASEYDSTYLYDAVSTVLGSRCPALDRLALYRFYENSIKPRETVKTNVRKYGIFHYTQRVIDTAPVPFCGAAFSLHSRSEFTGTPDMPNRNPKTLSFIDIE